MDFQIWNNMFSCCSRWGRSVPAAVGRTNVFLLQHEGHEITFSCTNRICFNRTLFRDKWYELHVKFHIHKTLTVSWFQISYVPLRLRCTQRLRGKTTRTRRISILRVQLHEYRRKILFRSSTNRPVKSFGNVAATDGARNFTNKVFRGARRLANLQNVPRYEPYKLFRFDLVPWCTDGDKLGSQSGKSGSEGLHSVPKRSSELQVRYEGLTCLQWV